MAIITYVDQYPNTANTGQVGTSGNPYDKMYARCVHGTVSVTSPYVCGACVCGSTCVHGAYVYSSGNIQACSNIQTSCGNICACATTGTGGCIYANCCICAGAYVSGACLIAAGGATFTECLCYYSQGCICVMSCLLDCNGVEILGGAVSLWYDGTGCIYPCNSCSVYACTYCGSSGYATACFQGSYCNCGVIGYADCFGAGVYACSCCGYGVDAGSYWGVAINACSYYCSPLVAYSGSGCQAIMCNGVQSCGFCGCDCCVSLIDGLSYACFCGGVFVYAA